MPRLSGQLDWTSDLALAVPPNMPPSRRPRGIAENVSPDERTKAGKGDSDCERATVLRCVTSLDGGRRRDPKAPRRSLRVGDGGLEVLRPAAQPCAGMLATGLKCGPGHRGRLGSQEATVLSRARLVWTLFLLAAVADIAVAYS